LLLNDPFSRSPRLNLLVNGEPLPGVIEAEVSSNNYYGADRFSALIALGAADETGAAFWGGEVDIQVDLQFSLDGGDSFVSLIQGAVDLVDVDPIANVLRIEGRDQSAALIEARTQETFANRTSSEVATLLAERHGLSPLVTSTTTPVGRYYENEHDSITLDQFSRSTTEWDLLVFLARQEGFDAFIQGSSLCFQPTATGPDSLVYLQSSDMIKLRLMRSLTLARDIEVAVKSWNSNCNSAFVQQMRSSCGAGGNGFPAQRYVYVRPNLTSSDALRLAQLKIAELTRHERIVELTMPGELTLTPRSMIALQGTGSDFDQAYYVDVIDRRLSFDNGFVQRIRARNASPRSDATS
jgi:phage protein D